MSSPSHEPARMASVTCSAVGRVRTWNGNVFEMRNAVSAARSSGSDRAARVREIPTRPP